MDTWLIFHDLNLFRWSDGVLYTKRIIGFALVLWGRILGKSGIHKPEQSENLNPRGIKFCGARFQEKLLSPPVGGKQIQSVPKTDTGSQVEKTKANEWEVLKELGKKAAVTSE